MRLFFGLFFMVGVMQPHLIGFNNGLLHFLNHAYAVTVLEGPHRTQVEKGNPVRITRRGKPVGVIIDPEEYERLRQVQAYLEMVSLSRTLRETDLTAGELYRLGRDELEGRP